MCLDYHNEVKIALKFETFIHLNLSCLNTLYSGINVGPTFINFGFFSRPYGLIREYIKVIQVVIYYIGHVYLMPYVYSFCQIFQALCLFPALLTSIPESRVLMYVTCSLLSLNNVSLPEIREERKIKYQFFMVLRINYLIINYNIFLCYINQTMI